jgi:hypothetical protein
MTAWVVERLAPQVDELLINANQNPERYAAFGHRVVPDQIPISPARWPACTPRCRQRLIRWWSPLPATLPSSRKT